LKTGVVLSLTAEGYVRRRNFIKAITASAAAWPLAAYAQAAMPVVGFMNIMSPESIPHWVAAFHQGLKETGFVDRSPHT
jgi:putative ABC transport system substrate-binding protein